MENDVIELMPELIVWLMILLFSVNRTTLHIYKDLNAIFVP